MKKLLISRSESRVALLRRMIRNKLALHPNPPPRQREASRGEDERGTMIATAPLRTQVATTIAATAQATKGTRRTNGRNRLRESGSTKIERGSRKISMKEKTREDTTVRLPGLATTQARATMEGGIEDTSRSPTKERGEGVGTTRREGEEEKAAITHTTMARDSDTTTRAAIISDTGTPLGEFSLVRMASYNVPLLTFPLLKGPFLHVIDEIAQAMWLLVIYIVYGSGVAHFLLLAYTGQAFNKLVREVKSRRDKGLPLLAIPGGTKPCNTLDQFNYPAPPSWYEEAVKEWDQKEEQRTKNTGVTEEGGGITEEGGRGQEAQVPMEQGDMKTSWSVPPTAPAQQIGLSTISLAETGTFIPVNAPIPLFGYNTRVPQDITLSSIPKPLFAEVEVAGLGKGASKQPAAVEGGSEVTGEDKHVEMEEAERKDKETTQAGGNEDSSHPVGRTLATPTPTEISSQTEPVASTFLPVLDNRAPPTAGTPQGEPVIPQPDTEDDFDYDNYLDQLDKEEEEDMPGPVSANPLNEDFPLIAPGRQNKDVTGTDGQSLKDLLIGGVSWSAKEGVCVCVCMRACMCVRVYMYVCVCCVCVCV